MDASAGMKEFELFRAIKPNLRKEGNKYCVTIAPSVEGIDVGFGDTPEEAILAWERVMRSPVHLYKTATKTLYCEDQGDKILNLMTSGDKDLRDFVLTLVEEDPDDFDIRNGRVSFFSRGRCVIEFEVATKLDPEGVDVARVFVEDYNRHSEMCSHIHIAGVSGKFTGKEHYRVSDMQALSGPELSNREQFSDVMNIATAVFNDIV